jgi:hypothetical protein
MMKKLKEEVTLLFDGSSLKTIAAVLMLSGMLFVPAIAHHSTAMFDHNDERSITGVVTKFDYINPHSWIFIEVTNDDGTVTNWGFGMSAASRLRRMRLSPGNWKKGDLITVKFYPLKDGRPAGALLGVINSDGKTFRDVEGLTAPTAS